MQWDLSCRDWEERLRAGRSLLPDLPLYDGVASRAVAIFDRLRLPDVTGLPTLGEAAGDWFRDIVRALLGSLDPDTGLRHIRELFALVPKKNAKTTNGAALMLTAALMNRRPRAEFLYVGPTQSISDIGFSQTVGMIEADPDLRKRVRIQDHLRRITIRETGAQLKIKTFDTKVMTGVKPVGVLVDELHELGTMAQGKRVIGQIRGGLLPNPEAFLAFITTQSDMPPRGVFKAELDKARAIRDGKRSGAMLPVLYEFPKDLIESKGWEDPKVWPMVNPNLDRSVTIARLIEDRDDAKETGEEEFRRWASQHLNIEIGLALMSDRWAGADFWEAAVDGGLDGLASVVERSEVLVAGIDGGGLDDLLGLAVVGREKATRRWLVWTHAWCHPRVLEIRKAEASRLEDLSRAGDLTIIVNLREDIDELADILEGIDQTGKLARVGLDPVGVGAVVDALAERDIGGETDATGEERVVGVSQGYKLTGAIKTAERKLADGTLVHAGQPLMAWCVGNAKVELKGNAVIVTKQASGTAKIDPLMATFDAVTLMSMNPDAPVDLGELIDQGIAVL
jgi:phage terminase large subunit-like protein